MEWKPFIAHSIYHWLQNRFGDFIFCCSLAESSMQLYIDGTHFAWNSYSRSSAHNTITYGLGMFDDRMVGLASCYGSLVNVQRTLLHQHTTIFCIIGFMFFHLMFSHFVPSLLAVYCCSFVSNSYSWSCVFMRVYFTAQALACRPKLAAIKYKFK